MYEEKMGVGESGKSRRCNKLGEVNEWGKCKVVF